MIGSVGSNWRRHSAKWAPARCGTRLIGYYKIERYRGRAGNIQACHAVGCFHGLVATFPERPGHERTEDGLIVNHEDAVPHVSVLPEISRYN